MAGAKGGSRVDDDRDGRLECRFVGPQLDVDMWKGRIDLDWNLWKVAASSQYDGSKAYCVRCAGWSGLRWGVFRFELQKKLR